MRRQIIQFLAIGLLISLSPTAMAAGRSEAALSALSLARPDKSEKLASGRYDEDDARPS